MNTTALHYAQKKRPCVLIRAEIQDQYLRQIQRITDQVRIEKWPIGQLEPALSQSVGDVEVIVTYGIRDPFTLFKHTPNLKWVHSLSVGLDSLLTNELRQSDVIVTNSKGCNAIPIAEYTITAILAWSKGFYQYWGQQKLKQWSYVPTVEVIGSTIGIVGYGSIGREIAKRAKALGMNVLACRRKLEAVDLEPVDSILAVDQISQLLASSDYVVNCLPNTAETEAFFNERTLSMMKQTSVLINVGRGKTVDEQALKSSIQQKRIAGAILDVFQQEPLPLQDTFWTMDNVYISPHNAYTSPKTMERVISLFCENLRRYMNEEPLLNVVDKVKGY